MLHDTGNWRGQNETSLQESGNIFALKSQFSIPTLSLEILHHLLSYIWQWKIDLYKDVFGMSKKWEKWNEN